jgi:fengycin family lipopeptide synthetase D
MLVDDFFARSASRFSDQAAIICEDRRVTCGEFDETTNRLAQALVDGGVHLGGRVAVFLENSIEAAGWIFGLLNVGDVFVVINHTTKSKKLEFRDALLKTGTSKIKRRALRESPGQPAKEEE